MPATIKDIQKATGLGLATISKYINGGSVRPANRILLDRAVIELGYQRNDVARALKTNRSKTIGVVIPELSNLFCTTIISSVEDALRQRGYGVIVCDCRSDAALERQAVGFLLGKHVDGILNMPVSMDGKHLLDAKSAGVPVVLIDRQVDGKGYDAIIIDNRQAAHTAVSHLVAHGHRQIGLVCGGDDVFTFRQRRQGYRDALETQDLEYNNELDKPTDHTVQGGYREMKRLLCEKPDMTAVFVANYEMTLGAVIAANESAVKIPDKLSFIGFDNLELSLVTTPMLTTVAQPMEEIASAASERLLLALEGGSGQPQIIMLSAHLVKGASVADISGR